MPLRTIGDVMPRSSCRASSIGLSDGKGLKGKEQWEWSESRPYPRNRLKGIDHRVQDYLALQPLRPLTIACSKSRPSINLIMPMTTPAEL